jgi:hypothetical protein
MDNGEGVFYSIVMCILLLSLSYYYGKTNGYEQGQIDAMNGKYKYEAQIDTVYVLKPE